MPNSRPHDALAFLTRMRFCLWTVVIGVVLAACQSPPTPEQTSTPDRQAEVSNPQQLCAVVETHWNQDWGMVVAALETLVDRGHNCSPDQPSQGKLYSAYFNYGVYLEANNQPDAAIQQYQAALELRPDGREARNALIRLGAALPSPPPLDTCTPEELAQFSPLPAYKPSAVTGFVQIEGDHFALNGERFTPQGINYFPANTPWRHFLLETEIETIQYDFQLLHETGFNTLRLFFWNEALFLCPGSGIVPNVRTFEHLDMIIHEAARQNLRIIMTLNDLADITLYPLYDDPQHIREQTRFIVTRYRDEAAIMAWDLRNEGDVDYTRYGIQREKVYWWLESHTELVRSLDPNHLITAGWLSDSIETDPFVDFVSFHYWNTDDGLRQRILALQSATDKPILLEELGYSTFTISPEEQSRMLYEALLVTEVENIAGWLIWTAFDYPTTATCIPPACPSDENIEHHFGLWTANYQPKPAVQMLQDYFLN